jgi:hypothetical protein
MATLTIDQKIAEAAEAYKSGQVPSKAALAKVKRLIRIKIDSAELVRRLAADDDAVPTCP